MTYETGTIQALKDIFSAVVVGAIEKGHPQLGQKQMTFKECLPRFTVQFSSNIFYDEYAILYEVLKNIKVNVFTLNQLDELLDRHRDLILKSPYIDMSKWAGHIENRVISDDEKVEAFRLDMRDLVIELSNRVVTPEQYYSACSLYINWYIDYESRKTAMNMAMIMSDSGLMVKKTRGRSVLYKGPEDMERYHNERMAVIKALTTEGSIKSDVVDKNWFEAEVKRENSDDEEAILDFGLSVIDNTIGSMRRSNIITLLGPPKGGKTRMANYLVHRALQRGLNVCVWPIDGTKEEWIATQVSCLLRAEHGIYIKSKRILERDYRGNEELRRTVMLAKASLATDMSRGRLSFISGSAYSEDFIDTLKAHYANDNPFDVLVIDQMVNMLSRGNKPKTERISEGYINLKNYINSEMPRKALAICPAQLKQTAIDVLLRNPEEAIEITAGGESAETIRSADEVIGLFSSREERAANQMHIYSVASRHSESFDDFVCGVQLGACYFSDDINVGNTGSKLQFD